MCNDLVLRWTLYTTIFLTLTLNIAIKIMNFMQIELTTIYLTVPSYKKPHDHKPIPIKQLSEINSGGNY